MKSKRNLLQGRVSVTLRRMRSLMHVRCWATQRKEEVRLENKERQACIYLATRAIDLCTSSCPCCNKGRDTENGEKKFVKH